MKKLFVFLLTLALSVTFFGCTETGIDDIQSGNTESQSIQTTEVTNATESTESTEATKTTETAETTEATKVTEATEVTNTTESVWEHPDNAQVTMVWIPTKGGKKYHSKESCSGMESPDYVTQSQAEQEGFTPCKQCYK